MQQLSDGIAVTAAEQQALWADNQLLLEKQQAVQEEQGTLSDTLLALAASVPPGGVGPGLATQANWQAQLTSQSLQARHPENRLAELQ
jgi:hypothetical protein